MKTIDSATRRILDALSEGIIIIRCDGIVVMMNQTAQDFFRSTDATSLEQLFGPERGIRSADGEPILFEQQPAVRTLTTGETVQGCEMSIPGPDGSIKWILVNSHPLQLAPKETGTVVSFLDITDRRQAEDRLSHTHDLMHYVISHARSAIAIHDRDLRYIFVSRQYLREYNVKEEDVIGRHHYDVFPDLPQKWRDVHQKALRGEVSSKEEDPYHREDGSVEWTRWECRPWFEADGSIGGIIIYTEVITERIRREQELGESEARYRALFEQVGDYVLLLEPSPQGPPVIVDMNEAGAAAHGFRREDLIGQPVSLLEPGLSESVASERFEVLQKSGKLAFVATHQRKDGTSFQAEVRAQIIRLGRQDIIVCIERDITERLLLEKEKEAMRSQLVQAQRMESVGRLAGGVAHDFNNMLGVILGHAELALDGLDPSDPLYASLKEIEDAALRSADLTRQLLAFARKQTATPTVLNLNSAVEATLSMVKRLIGEDIELIWRPGPDLWTVMIDPGQLDQVLANLCVNARDAISGIGKIIIETRNQIVDESFRAERPGLAAGEYVVLTVADSGCGIEKAILDRIFEPFFTTKELGKGTGLGLSTVFGVVKQNSGYIEVDSEPGRGSRFRIYLPRRAGTAIAISPPGSMEKRNRGTETVLLVEDEPALLKMAGQMLIQLGYRVLFAPGPGEATQVAETFPDQIDLLVTDVIMPGMNGRELSEQLSRRIPGLRVLFTSGYTADIIGQHGVLEPGVNFIRKPFSLEDLSFAVRKALELQ